MSWAFSASCVLKGYECQSPDDSSELPGYLDASPLPSQKYYLHGYPRILSDPPRQRESARARPWNLYSCVQTMCCRISKVCSACVHVSDETTRAKSRGGYLWVKVQYALVSTPATLRLFSQPPSTDKITLQPLYATPACRKQSLAWCARAGSGEG
jgi:hypothetical protein